MMGIGSLASETTRGKMYAVGKAQVDALRAQVDASRAQADKIELPADEIK